MAISVSARLRKPLGMRRNARVPISRRCSTGVFEHLSEAENAQWRREFCDDTNFANLIVTKFQGPIPGLF
jgi:hypothetical protein